MFNTGVASLHKSVHIYFSPLPDLTSPPVSPNFTLVNSTSPTAVELEWEYPEEHEIQSFTLEAIYEGPCPGSVPIRSVDNIPMTSRSYAFNQLYPNSEYSFIITVLNLAGTSTAEATSPVVFTLPQGT